MTSEATQVERETRVISSIIGGETHLFHDLIRPYERSVYIIVLSFLHNEADAEDAAQEAFLKAFRNLADFRGESNFSTWLISIALNEARSRLHQKRMVRMESQEVGPNEEGHVSPAFLNDWREIPSDILERQEMRLILEEAIARLPRGASVSR